jgi:hypothetical protein
MPVDPGADPGVGQFPDPNMPPQGDPASLVAPRGLVEVQDQSAADLLALDVSLLRQTSAGGGTQLVAIRDGEVLRDGRGDPRKGDKFKLVFRANRSCHVYVLSMDGSGWMQGVFPGPRLSFTNPVVGHREYMIPEGDTWFSLDQIRGIETLYLVASPEPRPDLDEALARLASHTRPAQLKPEELSRVEDPPVIPDGFGETRDGQEVQVRTDRGDAYRVGSTTYVAKSPGESLRVTRWFKHE